MARWVRGRLLLAAVVLTAACSGPGGVTLGHDWDGASTFALVRVDGLVTVVGINVREGRAESLAVVPQQADDSDVVSPHMVRLADGRWLVSVPRERGGADRRYLVNREDHVLDGVRGGEGLRRVLPGKTLVAEVAGLPGAGGVSSVLVKDPGDWTTRREVRVPGTIGFAASDPAADSVCLGGEADVSVAQLGSGKVTRVAVGREVVGLACPAGRPVVVVAGAGSGAGSAAVGARVVRTDSATTVSVSGGRVDAVAADGASIVVAVGVGNDTEVVEVDGRDGRELHRVRVEGFPASQDVVRTRDGWLVYAEESVARVDLVDGRVRTFGLPGVLLDT